MLILSEDDHITTTNLLLWIVDRFHQVVRPFNNVPGNWVDNILHGVGNSI